MWIERFIIDLLDIIKILIVSISIIDIPVKKSNKNFISLFFMLIISSYIKWSLYDNKELNKFLLLWMFLSTSIIMLCLMEIEIVKGILFFLLLYIINGNLDGIGNIVIRALADEKDFTIEQLSIYSSIITILFLTILSLNIKQRIKGNYSNISYFQLVILVIISFLNTIALSFVVEYLNRTTLVGKDRILDSLIVGVALGIYIEIELFIFLCINTGFYKERNNLNIRYLEAQKKQFKYLQEKEEATKHFRHDMKNHIFVLKNLCERQDWKAINQYVERMDKENLAGSRHIETGNSVVDAICNKHLEEANQKNIYIKISGHLPDNINVEDFDLCTIFSNLLSNAIEAVIDSNKKEIILEIRHDKRNIYIKEENPYTNTIRKKGNKILTAKSEIEIHGFGIQNIRKSILRYGGDIQIEFENHIWKIFISIPYSIAST